MTFTRSNAVRRVLALLLLGSCFLFSGCVYLRLLEVKNQLAKFDRNFAVDYHEGLKITCKDPVLLDEDMTFFKLVPEARDKVGTAEAWRFRWVKANHVRGEDPRNFEITADFFFTRHKLSKVALPERFFAFFPKELLVGMLRSVGNAKIDRANRTASAKLDAKEGGPAVEPMTEDEVIAMLGEPFHRAEMPDGPTWRYRYQSATPDQQAGSIDITLVFNPENHRVAQLKGKILDASVNFAFERQPHATIEAAENP